MSFILNHFSLQFSFKEVMARQHTYVLKFIKFTGEFTSKGIARQHMFAKHLHKFKIEKKNKHI